MKTPDKKYRPVIRNRGYYVELEDCRPFFGQTFLVESQNLDGLWNNECYCQTSFLENATYWPTAEEAEVAYREWMKNSKGRLAKAHRENSE
jgi:hypothetical protein